MPNDSIGHPGSGDGEYVVVARRYRPTTFDELIGQEHVATALSSAIATNRVGHAYLFTGARGVGKTSAARILAKALNCPTGPTATPCNTCEICQSVAAGEDVDVLEIDGASNRGIDEIRQLRQNAGVRPSRSRFKIYIIDEVHMLTKEAFNALLKTLEEPPEHVKFIFATTEPNKIPITILSRCQRFDFAGISISAIQQRLEQIATAEGVAADTDALALLARRAGGSMRDSQSLLEQLLSCGGQRMTVDAVCELLGTAPTARLQAIVVALVDADAAQALTQLDDAVQKGTEPAQLVDQLIHWYRDLMTVAVGCPAERLLSIPTTQFGQAQTLAEQLGIDTVLAALQILEQTAARMRQSLHPHTLAEMALVQIAQLENLENLQALLASLRSGESTPPATPSPRQAPKKNNVVTPDRSVASSSTPAPNPSASTPNASSTKASTSADGLPESIQFQGPLDEESVAKIWKHVIDNLGEMVADQAALSDRITVSGPNRLAVRFREKYTSCRQFCERVDQKARLEQALSIATGEPVTVTFETLADRVDREHAPTSRAGSLRQLQAEVVQRPFVRRALELFEVENPKVEAPVKPS